MSDYIKSRAKFMENLRRDRWHATYNAALTGLSAFCHPEGGGLDVENCHDIATRSANLAHGELVDE